MSTNIITLIGRVVATPEAKRTNSGKSVVNFNLAVDRRGKDQPCDFIPVVAWEKLADICGEYLEKGKQICVSGRLQTRQYEKDGQRRTAFEVLCSDMQMLGSRQDGQQQQQPKSRPDYGSELELEDIPF